MSRLDDPFFSEIVELDAPAWPPLNYAPPWGLHPVEAWLDELVRHAARAPGLLFPQELVVQHLAVRGVEIPVVLVAYVERDDGRRGVVEIGGVPLVDVHRAHQRQDPGWPNGVKTKIHGFGGSEWTFGFALRLDAAVVITRYIVEVGGTVDATSLETWSIDPCEPFARRRCTT